MAELMTLLDSVIFKAMLWEKMHVNERQKKVILQMLEDDFAGYMNTSKFAKIADCSTDTALRDIQALKAAGVFIQNSAGGRSTGYRMVRKEELRGGK